MHLTLVPADAAKVAVASTPGVVHETTSRHDTTETAQELPDADEVVLGSLAEKEPHDEYRLRLRQDSASLNFQVVWQDPSNQRTGTLVVTAEGGQVLMAKPLVSGRNAMDVPTPPWARPGSAVYVSVICNPYAPDPAPPTSDSAAGPPPIDAVDYQLGIFHVPPDPVPVISPGQMDPTGHPGPGENSPGGGDPPAGLPGNSAPFSTAGLQVGAASLTPTVGTFDPTTIGVADRSAVPAGPMRALAPPIPIHGAPLQGGLFDEGGPTPTVRQGPASRVDLKWLDGPPSTGEGDGSADGPGDASTRPDLAGLVGWLFSGGIPLSAPLLPLGPGGRPVPAGPIAAQVARGNADPAGTTLPDLDAPPQRAGDAPASPSPGTPREAARPVGRRLLALRRWSVAIGLQGAAVLMLGLLRADLATHLRKAVSRKGRRRKSLISLYFRVSA